MFIVSPFTGGLQALFSTHPPLQERIQRVSNAPCRLWFVHKVPVVELVGDEIFF
jgi:hypothetical protein